MSQPRQPTPTQSPTPSKSSLRRTSGSQNPSQRSLLPPPSPHFEEQPPAPVRYSPRSPPNQTLEYESDEDDEPLTYPDPPQASSGGSYFGYPEPETPFQPFFTLIEDGLTTEHHHPSVHYIFADDDTELITEAALRSLEQGDLGVSSTADNGAEGQSHINSAGQHESRLPPATEGIKEHYLILDVHPITQAQAQAQAQQTGQASSQSQNASQPDFLPSYAVTSFTSLSPDWQISSAAITSAPTMSDTPGEDEGLMLRIEGRGILPPEEFEPPDRIGGKAGQSDDKDTAKLRERENLEDMIERFQTRLGEVKKLIEIDPGGNIYRDTGMPGRAGGGGGDAAGFSEEGRTYTGIGLEEQD